MVAGLHCFFKKENAMSQHKATIIWERGNQSFTDSQYSREHKWKLDGNVEIIASSSPVNVPVPFSNPTAIDPEEAFVASISSCHMLWFLAISSKKKFIIDHYLDDAFGEMKKNENNCYYISTVVLQPNIKFSGKNIPSKEEQLSIHEKAHAQCFIANSVKSTIECKPIF